MSVSAASSFQREAGISVASIHPSYCPWGLPFHAHLLLLYNRGWKKSAENASQYIDLNCFNHYISVIRDVSTVNLNQLCFSVSDTLFCTFLLQIDFPVCLTLIFIFLGYWVFLNWQIWYKLNVLKKIYIWHVGFLGIEKTKKYFWSFFHFLLRLEYFIYYGHRCSLFNGCSSSH